MSTSSTVTNLAGQNFAYTTSNTSGTQGSSSLDPNDPTSANNEMFLQLMVAQMKNQDPTSPMDENQMMSQMAQMTSVEQLTNMAQSLTQLQSSASLTQNLGMIGHEISYQDPATQSTEYGVVTSVTNSASAGSKLEVSTGTGVTAVDPSNVLEVGSLYSPDSSDEDTSD